MTNNLKNFLEQYHDNEVFSDDQIGEIQYVIIPKILDLVEKEVEKKKKEAESFVPFQKIHYQSALKDISTIINQLRV